MRHLFGVAAVAAAPAGQAGHQAQLHVALDRVGLDAPALVQAWAQPGLQARRAVQPVGPAGGQQAHGFFQAGVKVLLHAHHVIGLAADLAADARKALGAGLQVGHADHVVVGHGHGNPVRGGNGQVGRRGRRLAPGKARHVVQVLAAVGRVLPVHHARQAFAQPGPGGLGKLLADARQQGGQRRAGGFAGQRARGSFHGLGLGGQRGRRGAGAGQLGAGAQGLQAGLRALAAALDYLLEGLLVEGQHVAAGQRAKQAGRDHAAVVHRQRLHVVGHHAARRLAHQVQHAGAVGGAVAGHHFFLHGVGAVRAGDDGGAVGRDQAARHGAAGLHQLGGDQDVHLAGDGHLRQHRGLAGRGLDQLDVVDGGAGALRHAGHRGGLRGPAGVFGQGGDPVFQHAAALAAQGHDGDGDHARLHGRTSSMVAP